MSVQVAFQLIQKDNKVFLETFESADQSVPGYKMGIDGDTIKTVTKIPDGRLILSGRGGWHEFGGIVEFRSERMKIRNDGVRWTARVGSGEANDQHIFSKGALDGSDKSISELFIQAFS